MAMLAALVDGVIGVDPHRDTLTAAAVSHLGGVLARTTTSADAAGYQQLLGFAHRHLPGRRCWAVEGAGSFGAGLTAVLQQPGEWVVEVGRPKRPASRSGAKSDALDAVRAGGKVERPERRVDDDLDAGGGRRRMKRRRGSSGHRSGITSRGLVWSVARGRPALSRCSDQVRSHSHLAVISPAAPSPFRSH
jgi:hypothetical protein